ncbi:conserved hypothetical protein [Ricinus communis]|uniref:Uncharacterized protein n=1 Tax=Ricinus communis TaxID=3988 RepID=B9STP6_RICCO|nr:conserved hypothetical protein [Ricinus communis]
MNMIFRSFPNGSTAAAFSWADTEKKEGSINDMDRTANIFNYIKELEKRKGQESQAREY